MNTVSKLAVLRQHTLHQGYYIVAEKHSGAP